VDICFVVLKREVGFLYTNK